MMKNIYPILNSFVCSLLLLSIFSCNRMGDLIKKGSETHDTGLFSQQVKGLEDYYDQEINGIPIFYNMYLTVDLSSLFEESDQAFSYKYLNPHDKWPNYLTSYKKALNIGVYAVDLSYVKAYGEFEYAGKYFFAMHKLAEGLGIPDDFFYSSAKRFENNFTNQDSMAYIANEIYFITDNYLKENNRANTAALIVIGGWLEAVYIACNLYHESKDNMVILDKIADQKTSLPQVIGLVDLSKEKNDYIIDLINNLKEMQGIFDQLAENLSHQVKQQQYFDVLYKKITALRKEFTN